MQLVSTTAVFSWVKCGHLIRLLILPFALLFTSVFGTFCALAFDVLRTKLVGFNPRLDLIVGEAARWSNGASLPGTGLGGLPCCHAGWLMPALS